MTFKQNDLLQHPAQSSSRFPTGGFEVCNAESVIFTSDSQNQRPMTNNKNKQRLSSAIGKQIDSMVQLGKNRTAEIYRTTLNNFLRFREGKDLPLTALNAPTLLAYERWMHDRGLTRNSSSFYLRSLRSAWHKSLGVHTADPDPFAAVYTGVDKTIKRPVPVRHKEDEIAGPSGTGSLGAGHVPAEFLPAWDGLRGHGVPAQDRSERRVHQLLPAQNRATPRRTLGALHAGNPEPMAFQPDCIPASNHHAERPDAIQPVQICHGPGQPVPARGRPTTGAPGHADDVCRPSLLGQYRARPSYSAVHYQRRARARFRADDSHLSFLAGQAAN